MVFISESSLSPLLNKLLGRSAFPVFVLASPASVADSQKTWHNLTKVIDHVRSTLGMM